jgi:gliotoxin/aspirochlorine biosynthesis aminotransferase
MNDRFEPASPVHPSHIVLAAGGSSALDGLIQQICDPGDQVMIATPYWSGLDISLTVQNEALILPVDIPLQDTTDEACIVYYDRAFRAAKHPVKALLLCNPTNPTGQCYPPETLQCLLDFCARNNLHFVSDEVYALSVHGGPFLDPSSTFFTSALALQTEYKNLHVIYSLSKDFGCSGIRLVLPPVSPFPPLSQP